MRRYTIIPALMLCLNISGQKKDSSVPDSFPKGLRDNTPACALFRAVNDFTNGATAHWKYVREEWKSWSYGWQGSLMLPRPTHDDVALPRELKRLSRVFDRQFPQATTAYLQSPQTGQHGRVRTSLRIPIGMQEQFATIHMGNDMTVRALTFRVGQELATSFVLRWTLTPQSEKPDSTLLTVWIHETSSNRDAGVTMQHDTLAEPIIQKIPIEELEGLGFKSVEEALKSRIMGTDQNDNDSLQQDSLCTIPYTLASLQEEERLQNRPHQHFNVLREKFQRIVTSSKNATPTEVAALALTLKHEADDYPSLLSSWQFEALETLVLKVKTITDRTNRAASPTLMQVRDILRAKQNRTPELNKYSVGAQDYLNNHGWHVTTHDPGHGGPAYHGEHYLSTQLWYLNAVDDTDAPFHSEHVTDTLTPGVYRLRAAARAQAIEHSGVFIYALADDGLNGNKYMKEIPGNNGIYGVFWEEAHRRAEHAGDAGRQPAILDSIVEKMNQRQGWGWFPVIIDNIVVRNGRLVYGMSNIPEFTGSHMKGRWCSACDFVLERVGDLPED